MTMTVTITAEEVKEAVRAHLQAKGFQNVKDVSFSIIPPCNSADQREWTMGGLESASALVEVSRKSTTFPSHDESLPANWGR